MKNFQLVFTNCEAGWIDFDIIYKNKTFSHYCFSYWLSSPADLLRWAEKIYNGNYSEFENDAEGWEWYFDYDGEYLTIADTLDLEDDNPEVDKHIRFHFKIDKNELCKTVYQSIKTFQKSKLYNPCQWEPLFFSQVLEKIYGTVENGINIISKMTLDKIIEDMKSKDTSNELEFYITDFFDEKDNSKYDSLSEKERKEVIEDWLADTYNYGFDGEPLSNIKSDLFDKVFQLQVE